MAFQSLLYLSVWGLTSLLVRVYGPSKTIAPIHGIQQPLLFPRLPFPILPHPLLRTLYHLSKFYEYLDILSVTAAGGAINLHFAFHHLTTPWLTFVRVLPDDPPGCHEGWRWFAAANAAHHVLMYAYFGGLGQTQLVREVLFWAGEVQFCIGMLADGWVVWERLVVEGEGVQELWRFLVSAGLLGTYWILNRSELREKEREERRNVKDN
ncbi:hypothetical protein C8A03DRAFT_41951 [Achaetomium macrosporum]|uniref:Uncharacterized protein n=1 Tax=Achaetomium macrosporum TaxID=79813 RepID=A0AAN7CGN3_9PEZI|nr:hypothetical protein C8A03DRAFT_41951 [Achaetomium macrosporum]